MWRAKGHDDGLVGVVLVLAGSFVFFLVSFMQAPRAVPLEGAHD